MGFLSIPKVNHCAGLILLIINCILPGRKEYVHSPINLTSLHLMFLFISAESLPLEKSLLMVCSPLLRYYSIILVR